MFEETLDFFLIKIESKKVNIVTQLMVLNVTMVTGVQRICCICSKNLSHTYIFLVLLKHLEYSGDGYLQARKKICKYV